MILTIVGLLFLWKSACLSKLLTSDGIVPLPCISIDDDVHPKDFSRSIADPKIIPIHHTSPVTDFVSPPISIDKALTETLLDDYGPPITDYQPSSTAIPLHQRTRPRSKPVWLTDFASSVDHPKIQSDTIIKNIKRRYFDEQKYTSETFTSSLLLLTIVFTYSLLWCYKVSNKLLCLSRNNAYFIEYK